MLNKQGPGKIDWTDFSWNPIAGCKHGCPYCYMLRMEKRFPGIMEPKFKESYLKDPGKIKNPSKIFVGSSGDMWGDWVDSSWIQKVLVVVDQNPQHTFQFLTKNPDAYAWFDELPLNGWYGTTVDGTERTRTNATRLKVSVSGIKFVSFEPLLKEVDPDLVGIDWVIIGANSNKGAEKPPMAWADMIIDRARDRNIPVFVKDNYGYPETIKEFPQERKEG